MGYYWTYARYSSKERAHDAIEAMFAEGEISECDRPKVALEHGRWVVQLWSEA